MRVRVSELVSPNRPQQMLQITDDVDISDQFLRDGRPATYVSFEATGEFPIRFWQVMLDFTWRINIGGGANPQFRIFSAYY